jgi:hypothetical protein
MIRLLTIAVALCLAAPAIATENLYPMPIEDMEQSPHLRAHPRSVAEYRRIVPSKGDVFGICRNAGHLDQCLWKINGHPYPPSADFAAFIKKLDEPCGEQSPTPEISKKALQ